MTILRFGCFDGEAANIAFNVIKCALIPLFSATVIKIALEASAQLTVYDAILHITSSR